MTNKTSDTKGTWYTIQVQPNREKGIAEKINNEIEKGFLKGVLQTLVPTEIILSIKDNKRIKREKILYPGYIFVETSSLGELQYVIKNTHGASTLLKDRSGKILPIRQSEIDRMSVYMKTEEAAINSTKFIKDELVSIISGPFNSFKGTISEVLNNKVKVSVSIFGRVTEVELDTIQIQKCTS